TPGWSRPTPRSSAPRTAAATARRRSSRRQPATRPGRSTRRDIIRDMRELLYNAARHYKRGKALAERGDVRAAMLAYQDALRDLHAVKPQRMRDVLLAQVYLSRYQLGHHLDAERADSDLRIGYSYAR